MCRRVDAVLGADLTKPRVDGAVVITVNHNSIAFLKCEKDIVQRCFARTALAS